MNQKKTSKSAGRTKIKAIKEAYLMALWSEAVKVRDGYKCIYCGKTSDEVRLNSHHVFSRRHNSVRYDLDNGITLCCGHHDLYPFSAHQSPAFTEWIIDYLGEKQYNELKERANQIKKWTAFEKAEIAKNLREYINKNKKGNNANK